MSRLGEVDRAPGSEVLLARTGPSSPILVSVAPPSGAMGRRLRRFFLGTLGAAFLWPRSPQEQGGEGDQEGEAAPGPCPAEQKATPDA